ncbi:hypothetical protein [Streptomyces sp. KL116D]|uniref:LexA family protein n=1 Tax=Streptomyces sp. KL116D TaxID=3045152 RepID=UPI003556E562
MREHRAAPTLARIGAVGLRSQSAVHHRMRQLQTLGLVRIRKGQARSSGIPRRPAQPRAIRPPSGVRTETVVAPSVATSDARYAPRSGRSEGVPCARRRVTRPGRSVLREQTWRA